MILFLPHGNIVHFDGEKFEVAVDGLVMANGIYVSKNQRYTFFNTFADLFDSTILIFIAIIRSY